MPTGSTIRSTGTLACSPASASTPCTFSAKKLEMHLNTPSMPKFETMLTAMNARLRSGHCSIPRADR